MDEMASWKARLYARVADRPDELALAAAARHGGWPEEDDLHDLLDFAAIEWVDAEGRTEVERAVDQGELPADAARWPREVRTALWVVDGWDDGRVLLRDVATEDEIAVDAVGREAELPRRAVVKGRLLPHGDRWVFSGSPDVYEPMGVVARMDLLRAWSEGPEPALVAHLARLRAGFLRQREERAAFTAWSGSDLFVAASAEQLADTLARFVSYLLNEHPFPSLGGATRAATFRAAKGAEPSTVQFALGPTLTGEGRHAMVYDDVEGVHFLPRFGELADHLRGHAEHPDVVRLYLDDPGLTALPFRRVGETAALARLLGVPDAPLDTLLAPHKDLGRRAIPSVLPGFDD